MIVAMTKYHLQGGNVKAEPIIYLFIYLLCEFGKRCQALGLQGPSVLEERSEIEENEKKFGITPNQHLHPTEEIMTETIEKVVSLLQTTVHGSHGCLCGQILKTGSSDSAQARARSLYARDLKLRAFTAAEGNIHYIT